MWRRLGLGWIWHWRLVTPGAPGDGGWRTAAEIILGTSYEEVYLPALSQISSVNINTRNTAAQTHVTSVTLNQSEASIQVTWSLSANERPRLMSPPSLVNREFSFLSSTASVSSFIRVHTMTQIISTALSLIFYWAYAYTYQRWTTFLSSTVSVDLFYGWLLYEMRSHKMMKQIYYIAFRHPMMEIVSSN